MALIEFKAELSGIRRAIERIAEALERAYPVPVPRESLPVSSEDMIRITNQSLWEKEQDEQRSQK